MIQTVLITANHTHSAPGGYSHYPFYSFPMGGIHFDVIETYANAIVKSILEAQSQLRPAVLKLKRAVFSPADQVAYNRSVEPYNANEDVVDKISPQEDYLGIDPEMLLLLMEDLNGKIIGSIDWFGVHTTSVGNECFKISSDNKGYAATYLEEEVPGTVMAFAQKPCGDISPNPPEARGPKRIERTFESDFERARKSGRKQSSKAMECIQSELFELIDGDVNTIP
jgi:neutral ceramidase